MKRKRVAMTLMAVLALGGWGLAHEGHEHKVMGKVVAIDERTITVEGLNAKKVIAMLGAETRYTRDKAPVARTDVKVGERVVVVIVEEKKVQNVKRVLLGTAATEVPKAVEQKH
jgi:hypothetical protein